MGSARLCLDYGVKPEHLCIAIACAIHYSEPADPFAIELGKIRTERGIDAVLTDVCGIEADGELGLLIKEKLAYIREMGWIA